MNYLLLSIKLIATALLTIMAIYSWAYFLQVKRIERQFGLTLPRFVKRAITLLAMLPMLISLAVIFIVFSQLET